MSQNWDFIRMRSLEYLPLGFAMWSPLLKATALFIFTFVLEDVAAVAAGLLLADGALTWPSALGACFLGIWLGDAGLYGIARLAGRSWLERTSLNRYARRVELSEKWFAQKGSWILIFSRVLPGARLPTYLAAGFLRVPMTRFLVITGTASLLWTVLILFATRALGEKVLIWSGHFHRAGWLFLLCVLPVVVVLQLAKRLRPRTAAVMDPQLLCRSRFGRCSTLSNAGRRLLVGASRWLHWEFWPAWLFYPPVALYCFWLGLKHRGLTLPTAANPGIFSGGVIGESKIASLDKLMKANPEFTAEAELLSGSDPGERFQSLCAICRRRGISYPLILKPDVGQRGVGVKLIKSEDQARAYLALTTAPILLQRYAPGPYEVGIFYYRYPDQPRGRLFAITDKIFPVLHGDGHSTIAELIWADRRARFLAPLYLQRLSGCESKVLAKGETVPLVQSGNHAQGCVFQDGWRLCTPELSDRIDRISQNIPGFFIGRYDVRFSSEEDLMTGRNFQIVELNGAASEATSIYDARNSLFSAYRILFKQWSLVFEIGAANRRLGCTPMSPATLARTWCEYLRLAATYPAAD